jgi:hypothetical protein
MKKLRANISWVLGNLYGEALRVGCEAILQGGSFDMAIVQKKIIEFPTLNMKWPEFKNFTSRGDAIHMFKLANTRYNFALKKFIIDGYTTDHIRVQQ